MICGNSVILVILRAAAVETQLCCFKKQNINKIYLVNVDKRCTVLPQSKKKNSFLGFLLFRIALEVF